jgi:hypothetical protein
MTFLTELERLKGAATKGESCWYDMDQFFINHADALAVLVRAAGKLNSTKDSRPLEEISNTEVNAWAEFNEALAKLNGAEK